MDRYNLAPGVYAPDFELPGIDKKVHHLSRYREDFLAIGVVFVSNNSVFVLNYIERLKQIQADFAAKGFTLIAINGNQPEASSEENLPQMKAFAQEHDLNFPYLRDYNQEVTHAFQAQVTPEVFLIDNHGILRYRGAIDDSPGLSTPVKNSYLRQAIAALLENQPIEPNFIEPFGSTIR